MIALDEMKERVLSELEEAGVENVSSLLNTVASPDGQTEQLHSYRVALEALIRTDLVRVRRDRTPAKDISLEMSLATLQDLDASLKFNQSEQIWKWQEDEMLEVVLTFSGKRVANDILETRGYQWWRKHRNRSKI